MLYPDDSGVGTSYFLPMLNSSLNPHYFASTFGMQVNDVSSCPTGDSSERVVWKDGSITYVCTDISSDAAKSPSPNFVENGFSFPSLWAEWDISADFDGSVSMDVENLALQIVFQFIESSTDSLYGTASCQQHCFFKQQPYNWSSTSPLVGEERCDKSDCSSCNALFEINGTQVTDAGFCLCNVWMGGASICLAPSPATVDSSSLIPFPLPIGVSWKRKVASKQAKSSKVNKNDIVNHKIKLQAALQEHLIPQCHHTALSDVSAIVDQCKSRGGKSFDCDFYLLIVYNSNLAAGATVQESVDSCIADQLEHYDMKLQIARDTESCYVSAENNGNEKIGGVLDLCDLFLWFHVAFAEAGHLS